MARAMKKTQIQLVIQMTMKRALTEPRVSDGAAVMDSGRVEKCESWGGSWVIPTNFNQSEKV